MLTHKYGFDFLNTLSQKIGDLAGFVPMCRELIQNADDEGCDWVHFEFTPTALIVRNPSTFSPENWEYIRLIGSEGKREDASKTGRFGVGFVSVFQFCDHPEIRSDRTALTLNPERQEATEEDCTPCESTEITLKWALAESEVRRGLKKATVRPPDIPVYCSDLVRHLPESMLFLRHIRRIEVVCLDGTRYKGWRPDDAEEHHRNIYIERETSTGRHERVGHFWWMVFEHRESQDSVVFGVARNKSVAVAFPLLGEPLDGHTGWLYTTLPTRTSTGLPISVNGDFAIKSDRMTIVDQGNPDEVEWNKALISLLADLYVSSMLEARDLVDDQQFANLLPSDSYSNPACPLLEDLPLKFIERVCNEEIVPTTDGEKRWKIPAHARLLSRKTDAPLYDALAALNAPIIVQELASRWTFLRGHLKVQLFSLEDFAVLLEKIIPNAPIPQNELPPPLREKKRLEVLWAYLDGELRNRDKEDVLEMARRIPLCPCTDGTIRCFEATYVAPERLIQAMPVLLLDHPLVEKAFEAAHGLLCEKLCVSLPWDQFVDALRDKTGAEIRAMADEEEVHLDTLYLLIADHEEILKANQGKKAGLRELCIYPSRSDAAVHPLTRLFLPGDFKDPIGLDILIDTTNMPERVLGTFKVLGLKSLTFIEYARRIVPTYFREHKPFGVTDRRVDLLLLIKRRASELEEYPDIWDSLKHNNCILASDGQYHTPAEVYVAFDGLEDVFTKYAIPDSQYGDVKADGSLRSFFIQLGANTKPQPEDLVREVRAICAQPVAVGAAVVEKIFYYLAKHIDHFSEEDRDILGGLRYIEWLPADGSDRYHLPTDLYLRSQAKLVGRKGNILRFFKEGEMPGSFRGTIGLSSQPGPDVIIANLRDLCEHGEAVDTSVYRALNDHVRHLEQRHRHVLAEEPLLYLGAEIGFVHGRKTFWTQHPFGEYRHVLPEELKTFRQLLYEVMGSKDSVEDDDYTEVLAEISQKDDYRVHHQRVSDTDRALILSIYGRLSAPSSVLGADAEQTTRWQQRVEHKNVVLCQSGQLKDPHHCFFADKEWLVKIFADRITDLLVDNDPVAIPFLKLIGVRPLSDAARAINFHEPLDATDSRLQQSLRSPDRRKAFRRIVETFRKRQNVEGWHVDLMLSTEIYECDNLEVEFEVSIENRPFRSGIQGVESYFEEDTQSLYVLRRLTSEEQRFEAARQLAGILCPGLDPATLASPLAYAIDYDRNDNEVQHVLSRLGMDKIEEAAQLPLTKDEIGPIPGGTDENEKPPGPDSEIHTRRPMQGPRPRETEAGPPSPSEKPKAAEEVAATRREFFEKRAQKYAERSDFEKNDVDAGFDDDRRPLTPEELKDHNQQVMVFYNREIRSIERRLERLRKGEEAYDFYSSEWNQISQAVRDRDGHRCRRCDVTAEELKKIDSHLTVHHIIPRKEGGSNWPSNLITLCISCHREVENAPELL